MEFCVGLIVAKLNDMHLKLSEKKTEVVSFTKKRKKKIIYVNKVLVGSTLIEIKTAMKYLGILIDERWNMKAHITHVTNRASTMAAALMGIWRNTRGPKESKRRLYASVIFSLVTYASPVWCDEVSGSRALILTLKKIRRKVALRVVCAYRTVSHEGASLLARLPPLHLLAKKYKELYKKRIENRNAGNRIPDDVYRRIRNIEQDKLLRDWRVELSGARQTENRIVAILPHFDLWMNRLHGSLNYYLTQAISGHGNFRSYLFRINRCESPNCLFCVDAIESAQHVIESCPEWEIDKINIRRIFNNDLSISGIISQMCVDVDKWKAFSDYTTKIMKLKDERERIILRR